MINEGTSKYLRTTLSSQQYLLFIAMGKLVDLIGGGVGLIAEASSGRSGRGNSQGMNNRRGCHELLFQGIMLMMISRLFSPATASKTIFI
jgi:hypothetical protein